MLAQFYVVIDENNPDLYRKFDDEGMQEFLIQQSAVEGVLYHTEMIKIKILYNTHNGEVKLVDDEEKKDINFDYSNAFLTQRKLVELAIRRLIKMELLAELNRMNDQGICEVIRQNHELDPVSGRICSNTSEVALDMTLVKIFKLGYSGKSGRFSLRRFLSAFKKHEQTKIQKAIYTAFEDFKIQCGNSPQVLDHMKSKTAIQLFLEMIKKYL